MLYSGINNILNKLHDAIRWDRYILYFIFKKLGVGMKKNVGKYFLIVVFRQSAILQYYPVLYFCFNMNIKI